MLNELRNVALPCSLLSAESLKDRDCACHIFRVSLRESSINDFFPFFPSHAIRAHIKCMHYNFLPLEHRSAVFVK